MVVEHDRIAVVGLLAWPTETLPQGVVVGWPQDRSKIIRFQVRPPPDGERQVGHLDVMVGSDGSDRIRRQYKGGIVQNADALETGADRRRRHVALHGLRDRIRGRAATARAIGQALQGLLEDLADHVRQGRKFGHIA